MICVRFDLAVLIGFLLSNKVATVQLMIVFIHLKNLVQCIKFDVLIQLSNSNLHI